jgi:predicted extracellular nuclease
MSRRAAYGVILIFAACGLAGRAGAGVLLTGIVDGTLSGGSPKAIELYVSGTEDLSAYRVERSANGGAFTSVADLTGSYTDAFVYLVGTAGNGLADFQAVFGTADDFANVALVSTGVSGNGNDAFRLVEIATGSVIDQVWTSDSGNVYLDSYLLRRDGTGPDAGWDPANWLFGGNDALDGLDAAGIAAAVPFGTFSDDDGETGGSACGQPGATLISTIQGPGAQSPLLGQVVSIEGVVVGAFQATDGTGLSGFFVQEEDSHADGDPRTSEGIFVFDPVRSAPLRIGDVVRARGTVREFARSSDRSGNSLTQLASVSAVEICTGLAGTATPALVVLPLANDPATDLEPLEGMAVDLVAAEGPLTLVEYFNLDRFGEIRLAAGGRPQQFTMDKAPDPVGYAEHLAALARRTILVDDGRSGQNLEPIYFGREGFPLDVQIDPPNLLRGGDSVDLVEGVLHYDFGVYRMQPVVPPAFVAANPRPLDPPAVPGRLRVASFNVLNYFQQLDDGSAKCGPPGALQQCRGADQGPVDSAGRDERERQEVKLVPALLALDADIYGLIELENDFGSGSTSSAQNLADLMNALNRSSMTARCREFRAVDPGDYVGTDAIAVGLLYCADTVGLAPGSTVAILDDTDLADLGLDHLAPLFNGPNTSRAPLAASFIEHASGEVMTVAVNHFKSKGDSGLAATATCRDNPAADPNCDQADGAGYWNARRTDTATALAAWLATDPTGSGDPDVLIIGDLNAYAREEPIAQLEALGYENLNARVGGYTFLFDGQLGVLDYALGNDPLRRQVRGIAAWHINADEPDALDYDISFNPEAWFREDAFRTSDHDPVLVGIDLAPAPVPGDLNGDRRVDFIDRIIILRALGSRSGDRRFVVEADYNGDGRIDRKDLLIWYGMLRDYRDSKRSR